MNSALTLIRRDLARSLFFADSAAAEATISEEENQNQVAIPFATSLLENAVWVIRLQNI